MAAAPRLHYAGKGFGKQHGRKGVDLQGLCIGDQVLLHGRLVGQHAVRHQCNVDAPIGIQLLYQCRNGGRVQKVHGQAADAGCRAAYLQVGRDGFELFQIATYQHQLAWGAGSPQAGALFGYGRGGAHDDNTVGGIQFRLPSGGGTWPS